MPFKTALGLPACEFVLRAGAPVSAQTDDAIYRGGDIMTMDDKNPTATALAGKSGNLLAVGESARRSMC